MVACYSRCANFSWHFTVELVWADCPSVWLWGNSCDTETLMWVVVLIVSALHDWLSHLKIFTHVSHLQWPSLWSRQFPSQTFVFPFSISLYVFLGDFLIMPLCKRATCQLPTHHWCLMYTYRSQLVSDHSNRHPPIMWGNSYSYKTIGYVLICSCAPFRQHFTD